MLLEGRRCRQTLNVRHAVVPSSDRIRDEIGLQNGCFPTARLAQPRAAKLCWFAAVCLHQYCERNDVALSGEHYSIGAQTARTFSFEARYSSVPAKICTADVPQQAVKIGTHARHL